MKQHPFSKKINILLVEDHSLVRNALHQFLSAEPDFTIVGGVSTLADAERSLRHDAIDIVLLDLLLGKEDALHRIPFWLQNFPKIKILVISATINATIVAQALSTGIHGFISKIDPIEHLIRSIRNPHHHTPLLSPSIQALLKESQLSGSLPLTKREREVLLSMAAGETSKEAAANMGVSAKTIDRHKENIKIKLNLKNNAELVRTAFRIFPVEEQ